MASYQVICITKPNVESTTERITKIGYYESSFKPKVIITVDEAIERIKVNPEEFYVKTGTDKAFVKVEKPTDGRKPYIRTIPDSTKKDNLLSLPQC
jgi:hypothetical protein